MEVLAPASNMEHIKVAIDCKANAVYGGLKNWNARNKAINFSDKEYNLLIEKLHKYGIKFFLTLNILLFDNEIDEIVNFLKNNKLPDSFIVTDIGLIQRLHKEFPNIPLHFSTQFGIHSKSDIKFAESINANRAILARELTLDEVSNIKKISNIEIENFVWGSQCISFSGLCFFGSLINCGNSNRGKCIITCRDMYKINNDEGNLLYIPDLDCTKLIEKLDEKNIECIKLEGRRRKPEEIAAILKQINNKIYDENQNGYLFGEKIIQNKLYEKINKRIKPLYRAIELETISEFDVFIEYKNGVPVKIERDLDKKNVFYVYSEYKKSFMVNKNNVSLDLTISGNEIIKVLYINSNGEGHTFISNENDKLISIEINDIVIDIKNINDLINLYKIKYIRNIENNYFISKNMYNEILNFICKDNADKADKAVKNEENRNFKLNELFVEVDNENYVERIISDPFVKIIYNIATVRNFENIKEIVNKYGDKIIYKLPLFNFKSIELNKYYDILKNKEVMFTRPSQIYETKDISFKKKYIDYTVYIWNRIALDYFKNYGIDVFTASPELSFQKNLQIFDTNEIQFIIGGKLPLVYTRQCFSHLYNCKECNLLRKNDKNIYNLDKNLNFKMHCYSDYRIIFDDNPILNNFQKFDIPNNITFRYITNGQNLDEVLKSIEMFKIKDYFNVMKKNIIWNNSYEGNIVESRC